MIHVLNSMAFLSLKLKGFSIARKGIFGHNSMFTQQNLRKNQLFLLKHLVQTFPNYTDCVKPYVKDFN